MLLSIWGQVIAGNLLAIDRAVKIGERRAKLEGLDQDKESAGSQGNQLDAAQVLFYIPDNGRQDPEIDTPPAMDPDQAAAEKLAGELGLND
jgi:hypothetical protein